MSEYEARKRDSLCWYNKANDLRGAAGALWYSIDSQATGKAIASTLDLGSDFQMTVAYPVYFMLCGMSLELVFKAIIVAKGKEFKTIHYLDRLASAAGVRYTKSQVGLLKILTGAIYWDGRFPVPLAKKDWEEYQQLSEKHLFDRSKLGDIDGLLTRNDALDWDSYTELWLVASRTMCEVADWLG